MLARVLIFDLDRGTSGAPGKRGPAYTLNSHGKKVFNPPIAIIWDPSNLGVGDWVNTASTSVFWTMPGNHPQMDLIAPMQCHYRVETYRNGAWQSIDDNTDGLVTDIDATGDEVVVKGQSYVSLLNRTVERRFKPKLGPDVPINKGGSKYVNQKIEAVIADQLATEAKITSSPVGFIEAPDLPGWSEKVTIYSIFKNRLDFIGGLMESHAADTAKRPRIRVIRTSRNPNFYDPTTDDETYKWVFEDEPGTKRDELRLDYGGLVQGFRVIPFGDNWATEAMGVGRTQTGTLPQYATSTPDVEGGGKFPEWYWGSFPLATIFADIQDENDLKRRTAHMARRAAFLGQSVGLALAVDYVEPPLGTNGVSIEPTYDWKLLDHFPIHIDRNAVHTELYNDGYWTVVGWQWRLFVDGHTELVLTFEPHDDLTTDITPDLIPSVAPPGPTGPVRVGCGQPEVNNTYGERMYYDRCSGLMYQLGDCPTVESVPYNWVETFTRTINPFVANDSEFVTNGITRRWSSFGGTLAGQLLIDGLNLTVGGVLTYDPTDSAFVTIPILSDDLAYPVELLVAWHADVDMVAFPTAANKAKLLVSVAGQTFTLSLDQTDLGGATSYSNGDVLGPTVEHLSVQAGSSSTKIASYSNAGSTVPLASGESAFNPDHAASGVTILARLRVEWGTGSHPVLSANIWFGDDPEPTTWMLDHYVDGSGSVQDPKTQPLTLELHPYPDHLSNTDDGITRSISVEQVTIEEGETANYLSAGDGVEPMGTATISSSAFSNSSDLDADGNELAARVLNLFANAPGGVDGSTITYHVHDMPAVGLDVEGSTYQSALDSWPDPTVVTYTSMPQQIVELTVPDGANFGLFSLGILGTNNSAGATPADWKLVILDSNIDFDALDGVTKTVEPKTPAISYTQVIAEGHAPVGGIGTQNYGSVAVQLQVTAGTKIQLAFLQTGPAPLGPLTLSASGIISFYQGLTDYCWQVAPPVPWQDFNPAQPYPDPGQIVPMRLVGHGDGTTQFFYTTVNGLGVPLDPAAVLIPYQPGSLRVRVDTEFQNVAETTPGSGLFFLDFAPLADEDVYAEWRRAAS